MSNTIEQRVVEMRFDNKQFESATATSMSTIDKLKQKLNFTGASKGLENVSAAAKKVDMSGLGSAVESVRVKFSALEVMGVTALANIANSAVNAGKRMVSALTLDPITTGFQEYETQINAIQTILANTQSKGTTLTDVTAALDELNKYADQTIYNFTEMTRNIGTFTAAGVDLDKSVTSIKGIANLAAVSGSNATQASTAMYQLSQALAAGRVSLMDWNSVVNAGMGGEVFQTALKRTAENFGYNVDAMIAKYGSFRESLTEGGWLTAEVLTETLTQLSGAYTEADLIAQGYSQSQAKAIVDLANTAVSAATDVKTFTQLWDTLKESAQSGWTQSWELIIGDFEQAKGTLSEFYETISGAIQSSADARNAVLEGAMTSKWEQVIARVNEAGVSTEKFQSSIIETAKKQGIAVDDIVAKSGSLEEAFQSGALSSKLIVDTLKNMAGVSKETGTATEDMTAKLEKFQKVVDQVWQGDFKNGEERMKALAKAGYDYAEVQDLVNKTVDGHRLKLEDLSDAQLKSVGYTDEEVKKLRELAEEAEKSGTSLNKLIEDISKPSGRELLWDGVLNVIKSIISLGGAVKEAWNDAFAFTSDDLYNLIEGFHGFTEALVPTEQTLKNITSTFKGLFAILDIFATITGGALRIGLRTLGSVLGFVDGGILGVTASVGEVIAGFRDWLFENNILVQGLEKLASGIGSGIKVIGEWINAFIQLPIVQKNITRLQEAFWDTVSNMQDYFNGGIEVIGAFIDRVKQLDSLTLDDVKNIIRDFKDNVVGYFLNVGGVFSDLGTAIVGFKDNILDYFSEAGESLSGFAKVVANFVSSIRDKLSDNIGLGEILTIGIGAGIILFAKQLGDVLSLLTAPLGSFVNLFDGLGDVLQAYEKKVKAEALLKNAQAIATLAGAVAVLALLDQGKVWSSVAVLGVLAAGLTGLSIALGAFNKVGGMAKSSVGLVALSSSILILATALKQMDSLNPDNIGRNLAILGTLGVGLAGVSAALGRAAPQLSKGSVFLLSFSISLKLLVSALSDLESIDVNKIGDTIVSLVAAVSAIAVLTKVTKGASFGSAAGIIGAALALKMLVGTFDDIAELDTGKMKQNMEAFVAIFGMFSVLMVSSKFAGANAAKAGTGIIAMSAALILIVQAFKMMAKIEPSELDRASDTVAKLLLVFGAVVALSNFAGQHAAKAGVMLLLMSGALLILSAVMTLLTHLDPEGMDRALAAITQLELIFGVLIAVSKLAGEHTGSITSLTIALGALALAVGALSFINPENLKSATTSLSMLMGMFSIMVASTKLAQKANLTLITMTLVVSGLAGILALISGLPVESTLSNAAALSLLLTSLSTSILIISNARTITGTAYAALGVMTLTVAGLAAIIGVLASMDVGPTLEISQSLSLLLMALSGACLILSGVGMLGSAAIQGALALDAVIVVVGGLMVGIGALASYYPAMEEFVNKGIGLLQAIGQGIGAFVGGIVGGIAEGISSGLPGIADNLSQFMANLQPFIAGASSLDASMVDGVKNLASAILILTGANLLESLTSWVTGGSSLASFAEQLVPFGQAMSDFSVAVAGLDASVVENAANAGKAIAEMASTLPNSGGVVGFFAGENDMSTFAPQLKAFGQGMMDFANAVSGLDAGVVENAANAGKALAEMAATLPNTGGVVGFFAGENDMSTFGPQLKSFGQAMMGFATAVTGLDPTVVQNASTAGKALAEMAATLPNSGGVLGFFSGENDMSIFASQLVPFGSAMKAYSLAVAGMDTNAVVNSVTAGQAISELARTLPNTGGLIEWFTGGNDMAAFGQQLISFGQNFATYATYMAGIDANIITTTANAAQSIVTLANSLPESGGWFSNDTTLDSFGEQLSKFGGYFSSYYASISGVNASQMSSSITQLGRLIDMAKGMSGLDTGAISNFGKALGDLGKSGVDNFIRAFTDANSRVQQAADGMLSTFINSVNSKGSEVTNAFNKMMTDVLQTITNKQTEITNAAATLMTQFSNAIKSKSIVVVNSFTQMMTQSVNAVRNKYSEFVSAGSYIVQGLAQGIKNNASSAVAEARAMARAVEQAAKTQLDIRSPSRVMMAVGSFVVQGLANGIKQNITRAKESGETIATFLIDSVKNVLDIGEDSSKLAEEVIGETFVNGIAEGIEKNMKAEEVAAKKAENIATAFSNALEKIDLSAETDDLQYQLWDALNGSSASETAKNAVELEKLNKEYDHQAERLELAKAKYAALVDEFGEQSQEAKEAYNAILQQQITLADLSNQIADLKDQEIEREQELVDKRSDLVEKEYELWKKQNETTLTETQKATADFALLVHQYEAQAERAKQAQTEYRATLSLFGANASETVEAYSTYLEEYESLTELFNQLMGANQEDLEVKVDMYDKYASFMKQNRKKLEEEGYSISDIHQKAMESTKLDEVVKDMDDKVKEAVGAAMGTVQDAYAVSAESALNPITAVFSKIGSVCADALGQGLQNGAKEVASTAAEVVSNSTSAIADRTNMFTDLGYNATDGFVLGIQGNLGKVLEGSNLIAKTFVDGLNAALFGSDTADTVTNELAESQPEFSTAGQNLMQKFVEGLNSTFSDVSETMGTLISAGMTQIVNKYHEFDVTGQTVMTNFIAGVRSQENVSVSTFVNIVSRVLTNIRNYYPDFVSVGHYLSTGMAKGIKEGKSEVINAAISVAVAAIEAAKKELQINSPSKVGSSIGSNFSTGFANGVASGAASGAGAVGSMVSGIISGIVSSAKKSMNAHSPSKVATELGGYFGQGFVNGISAFGTASEEAASGIANSAINGLGNTISKISEMVNDTMDTEPTIRPVVDLSDVQEKAKLLNATFSRDLAVSANPTTKDKAGVIQNGEGESTSSGGSPTFIQNNYSPKALSRTEIYRQTKNLFSARERMTNA